ncbi:MAG TPA: hypothetical protein VJP80_01170 [Candidatus Saccharimonadales bacterium]|nr:hypothetical protein [Candidatus Saccharimonadales bacterium]
MGKKERSVAHYLIDEGESRGCLVEKLHCEDERGHPDYLVTFPSGAMKKIETKAKDGELSRYQMRIHERYATRRCFIRVVYTREQVDEFYNDFHREWLGWELL